MIPPRMLELAANTARGLAMDAVHRCSSGHLGLPLGAAEIGAVLFGQELVFDPAEPRWLNRDRFVLSAGHGSMFLYAWLHLAGYDLPLSQIRDFRALGSITPGHPEFGLTPGVEATTGPLGQGIGNAVGMALARRSAAARFNTAEHPIFDYKVVCLAGDGCMQEGVALESVAFAGHQKLGDLILIYDSNDVTLDAMAAKTQSEDTAARFRAQGWDVRAVDGHDPAAFAEAMRCARNAGERPQLIVAKTVIGQGIPEVAGTAKAHGEGGAKFVQAAKAALGLPPEPFHVPAEVREFFAARRAELGRRRASWQARFEAWKKAYPDQAALLDTRGPGDFDALLSAIPTFPPETKIATRKAGSEVLQPIAAQRPLSLSGSADLHGSTLNYIAGSPDCEPATPQGRNIRFGIREHAMGAILNGMAYDGVFHASGATFLVFSDYLRPSIRLAALSHLPVVYIFTHDSVGVGEDGPTHQPVETVSSLRLIPNLDVIRPADPEETAGAFAAAFSRRDGPTVLVLTRQVVPNLTSIPAETRRRGVLRGGYIARLETSPLTTILLTSGSELHLALAAAEKLGPGTRVVSLPSFLRFDRQPLAYRESVLPSSCRRRFAIEAGVTALWSKYVGLDGAVIGIDRFGLSAPGGIVMQHLGVTAEALVERASVRSA